MGIAQSEDGTASRCWFDPERTAIGHRLCPVGQQETSSNPQGSESRTCCGFLWWSTGLRNAVYIVRLVRKLSGAGDARNIGTFGGFRGSRSRTTESVAAGSPRNRRVAQSRIRSVPSFKVVMGVGIVPPTASEHRTSGRTQEQLAAPRSSVRSRLPEFSAPPHDLSLVHGGPVSRMTPPLPPAHRSSRPGLVWSALASA